MEFQPSEGPCWARFWSPKRAKNHVRGSLWKQVDTTMVLRLLCGTFFSDLDTIVEEFLGLFRYAKLRKSKSSASKKIFKKPSVFAWFCKGGGSLWKSDDMNERYFLSSENGFMLTSFIRSIFHFIWEAFGASFGSIWTSKTSPNHDPNKRSKNDQS